MKKERKGWTILFGLIIGTLIFGNNFLNQSSAQEDKLNGIDVSAHQHRDLQGKPASIEWLRVSEQNYQFAFVKATQGTTYVNGYFSTDMTEGKKANILMGPYHFAEPNLYLEKEELIKDAENEARHFLKIVQPYLEKEYLRPVLDLEDASKNYPQWGVHYFNPSTGEILWNIDSIAKKLGLAETKERLSIWINKWIEIVKEKGEPIIYSNRNYASHYLNQSLREYPLWFSWPTNNPNNFPKPSFLGLWKDKNWDFWQYSWEGSVQGIKSKYVDLDLFNGDLSRFSTFKITPPPQVSCPTEGKLQIGQGVYVTDDGVRVREEAGLGGRIITTLKKESPGVIQEGPIEKDGYTWWKVRYLGTTGWSAGEFLKPRLIIQPFDCLTENSLRELVEKVRDAVAKKNVSFFIEKTNFENLPCQEYQEYALGHREYERKLPQDCLDQKLETLVPSISLGIIGSEGYPITKNEFKDGLKKDFNQPRPSQVYGVIYPFEKDLKKAHLVFTSPNPMAANKRLLQIFVLTKEPTEMWKIKEILLATGEFKGFLDPERNLTLIYPRSPGNIFYQVE